MRQPSHRKRARRLLKLLKELQDADRNITPPTLVAIKHLLQLNNRCKFIEVKVDSMTANSPIQSYRCLLPKFIVSQLEEQKLTDRRSERVAVPPIVAFVIQSLPSASCRDRLYPTLFRWYYQPCHRTYYVFAHINHNMARRTYTLTELMGLRVNHTSAEIQAMAENPAIGRFCTCFTDPRSPKLTATSQPRLFAVLEASSLLDLAPVADHRLPGTRTIRLSRLTNLSSKAPLAVALVASWFARLLRTPFAPLFESPFETIFETLFKSHPKILRVHWSGSTVDGARLRLQLPSLFLRPPAPRLSGTKGFSVSTRLSCLPHMFVSLLAAALSPTPAALPRQPPSERATAR